jgi:hypothetical protein
MWQGNPEADLRWGLRHEILPATGDRLLDSVTVADRGPPPPAWAKRIVALLAGAGRRLFKQACRPHPAADMVRHPSK